jgi:membrane-bound metal-dependent hydrolase YbcI (DUF457 family)
MDNLTHTLIGVAVAESGLSRKFGRGATWVLAITSNLPDVDAILILFGTQESFLYRRMFTHSILGVLIISLVVSFLFKLWIKNIETSVLFSLSLLGMSLHVFCDLINSYGVVLLYPFSRTRFEFGTMFIIDLTLWGLLLFPVVGLLLFPPLRRIQKFRERCWRISASGVAAYIALSFFARAEAWQILKKQMLNDKISPSFSAVFPEALGLHRFRGVIKSGSTYDLYQLNLLKHSAVFVQSYATFENVPEVMKIRQSERAQKLEWFFKAPVWQKDPQNPGAWEVFDLRFVSTVLKGKNPFFTFKFNGSDEKN